MLFEMTQSEVEKVIEGHVRSLDPLIITTFPAREKKKYILLTMIAPEFQKGVQYTETDVNFILMPIHHDYATIRRYLVNYNFLARTADGRAYWVPERKEELL